MQYRIALDPQIELLATEFVAAWNASPSAKNAPAIVDNISGQSFLSPDITLVLITAAAAIPTTVLSTFISDYLKKKFINKDAPKVTVTTISTPDGEPVLIIKKTES
jgi:hypothetical protein